MNFEAQQQEDKIILFIFNNPVSSKLIFIQ